MQYLCAGYDRLSEADNKNDESSSIQSQKMIIDSFAKFNNLKIVKHYVDDGYSGGNFDRPGFLSMIKDIESGKINCIITKDLSRLGREMYKTGKYIAGFKEGIEVTDITMKKLELDNNIRAVLSIHLNNKFVIHDITLREKDSIEGMRRFELHMPCRMINENVVSVVYLMNENIRTEIFNNVIEKYKGM